MRLSPLTVLAVLAAPVFAAETAPPKATAAPAATARADAPDSPRTAVGEYLDLARRGRHEDAARHLWLSSDQQAQGPELAKKLRAVLERHAAIDIDRVSPGPEGDATDGQPENTDAVGLVDGQPVLMVRTPGSGAPAWKFAPSTVARV